MMERCAPWVALLVLASVPLRAADDDAKVEVREGVVYAMRGDRALELDVALPAGGGESRPGILLIHGGGWAHGERGAYAGLIRRFAARGFVAATASYRLSGEAVWPAQLEDVADAARWMRAHADELGLDPRRLGALGHSAGGHLSLRLGVIGENGVIGKSGRGIDARPSAVVNFFGPTDLVPEEYPDASRPLVLALVGGASAPEAAERLRDASPLGHVGRGDAPVLTFHGTEDELVPVAQARALHEALDAASVPNVVEILEGQRHGWGGEEAERSLARTDAFLDAYLRGSELPLLVREDFDDGLDRWRVPDPDAWRLTKESGDACLELVTKRSRYEPPVRSPYNFVLLEDTKVTDFVLDVSARSTHTRYGHQDLCLFFGWTDPSHFYYVHFGRAADAHANSIFLVNGEPRVSIAKERTDGTDWSEGWHRLRVRRVVESGLIEVYFDDMERPVMRAEDRTFGAGLVGVGSFDDIGRFDDIRLRGRLAE